MGQVALGLRSLLVRVAVFFALAAALAWILGGTLFPRPERVDRPPVTFASKQWHVRMSVGGDHPGEARYELMSATSPADAKPVGGEYADAAELVTTTTNLFAAMRRLPRDGGDWVLRTFDESGRETTEPLADRLAAEQALSARRAGSGSGARPER